MNYNPEIYQPIAIGIVMKFCHSLMDQQLNIGDLEMVIESDVAVDFLSYHSI